MAPRRKCLSQSRKGTPLSTADHGKRSIAFAPFLVKRGQAKAAANASPLGYLRAGIYDINRLTGFSGPPVVQAQRHMAHLAMPCAKQRPSRAARMGKGQFVAKITLLLVRRVGEQRTVTREMILINLLALGRAHARCVEGTRESIQNVEQHNDALRRALGERKPGKRLKAVAGKDQAPESGRRYLSQIVPRQDRSAPPLAACFPVPRRPTSFRELRFGRPPPRHPDAKSPQWVRWSNRTA